MNIRRRYFALAGAVATTAGLALAVAPGAQASTHACDTAAPVGVCASWNAEVPGLPDLDALGGGLGHSGQAIIVFPRSATDKAEDFIVGTVNPAAVSKYTVATSVSGGHSYTMGSTHPPVVGTLTDVFIEYAPLGVPSGFCVSSVNPNGFAAVQLRGCSNNSTEFNPFQTFVKDDTGTKGDGQFVTFAEAINNHLLTDPANNGSVGVVGNRVHVTTTGGNGATIRTGQLWGRNGN